MDDAGRQLQYFSSVTSQIFVGSLLVSEEDMHLGTTFANVYTNIQIGYLSPDENQDTQRIELCQIKMQIKNVNRQYTVRAFNAPYIGSWQALVSLQALVSAYIFYATSR